MFHLFPIFLRFRVPRRRGRVRKDDREWEPAPLLLLVQRTAVERHRRRRGLRSLFLRRVRCEEEGVERMRGMAIVIVATSACSESELADRGEVGQCSNSVCVQ